MRKSVTLISLLLCMQVAKAQIVYFDITPDITLNTWNSYSCNINRPDSLFSANYFSLGFVTVWWHPGEVAVNSTAEKKVQVLTETTGTYPMALAANTTIDASGKWVDAAYNVLSDGSAGQWTDIADKYLGVRYQDSSNNWHYGWIRMDVAFNPSQLLIIKDRAYNSGSGSILAGQKSGTGVENILNDGISIINNGSRITCTGLQQGKAYSVSLTDMNGRCVRRSIITAKETTDISELIPGVYIFTIQGAEIQKVIKLTI